MAQEVAVSAMRLQEKTCDLRNSALLRFPQTAQMDTESIRKGLMKPGKNQRGLAKALGLDPSAINRLLKNKRELKASEIAKVQAYLEAPTNLGRLKETDTPPPATPQAFNWGKIEVRGMAECGPDGWSLWNGEVVDIVDRPANLSGVAKAYAVFAVGESMLERYQPGELIFIHPSKPPTPGCFVLVQLHPKDDGSTPRAILKRLVKQSGSKIILEQFNPPKTFNLAQSEVISVHRVVGSSEA